MFRSFRWLLLAVALIPVFSALRLAGQTATGRFSGQITDPDGAAIPSATIQIVNQDTLVKREAQTDTTGAYTVPGLPRGHYQLIVEAQGFSRRSSQVLTLAAG